MAMEEAPPSTEGIETKWKMTVRGLPKELKKVPYLAAPMLVGSMSRYVLLVVSVMMTSHLGKLSLSSVAIASAFTNINGFNLLVKLFV